eukprot:gene31327-37855_t
MIGSRLIRTASVARTQVRNMGVLESLSKKRAKFYSNPAVGADNPTYLKESGDKVNVTVAFLGVTMGVSVILKGLWDMSWGVNKVAK